jgi:serine/threonine protein kinase/WD40 repeat protein
MAEWNPRANDLFLRAAEIDACAERQAFLDQQCGTDSVLRKQVERLLAASDKAGSFLDRPAQALGFNGPTAPLPPLTEGPGTVIGPYKLLQQIGEGGMGVVYMAEQHEPVRRRVALKIIKPGMDSAQVIARFEAERQALALMDHQNIARVFDGGTTESGRPYFVMELVHGVPITRFCDDNRLTPQERLALFMPVCQAIQHAHHKGVIHRDVKPSNVLVTMYDDKPVPKVIDFGVAKAIEQRLTERSLFTQFGALVGTFEYMSPEQAEMNAFGVDTRSDIYSLGVLLYELLTGTTPLERKRLREAALGEVVRLIKEEEPPRPSARLSSTGTLATIAAARKTEPAQLSKLVRGEIDWIVMKCLEKDRSRRYDTASGLAKDIERYLADETVEACPPSAGYRLRKLARRYKEPLATAFACMCLLLIGVVASVWQAIRAKHAEGEALTQRDLTASAMQEATAKRHEAEAARDQLRRLLYTSDLQLTQVAWEAGNLARVRDLLQQQRPGPSETDLRGFEWHYWNRLCRKELRILSLSTSTMHGMLSPNGTRIAVLSGAGAAAKDIGLRLWDAATGEELAPLRPYAGEALHTAGTPMFSGDGRRVVFVGFFPGSTQQIRIKVLETDTGRELLTVTGLMPYYPFPALDCMGHRLALLIAPPNDKLAWKVALWDVVNRKELRTISLGSTEPGRMRQLALSPDGTRLAVLTTAPWGGGDAPCDVQVWDASSGQELVRFQPGQGSLNGALQFSPDGQVLAVASSKDTSLKLRDATSGEVLLELTGLAGGSPFIAFSPDGARLASAAPDGGVLVWEIADRQSRGSRPPVRVLKGSGALLRGVAFTGDGHRIRAITVDGKILTWEVAATDQKLVVREPGGQLDETAACASRFAAAWHLSKGKTVIKVWDETGRVLFSTTETTLSRNMVTALVLSPDGSRLAYSAQENGFGAGKRSRVGKLCVWDVALGRVLYRSETETDRVRACAFSPDGRLVAFVRTPEIDPAQAYVSRVAVRDLDAGKEVFAVDAPDYASLSFSPDGRRLAAGLVPSLLDNREGELQIWDIATGAVLVSRKGFPGWVAEPAWNAAGTRLALRVDKGGFAAMHIVAADSGKDVQAPFKGHGSQVQHAFSPDERRLVSCACPFLQAAGEIKVWDAASGRELLSLPIKGRGSFAFSKDGYRLWCASGVIHGSDVEMQVWDATPLAEES